MSDGAGIVSAEEWGFRVRVPATALWFNVGTEAWARIADELLGAGGEMAQGGLEGEVVCAVDGLVVSYRTGEGRVQAELGPDAGLAAARCLGLLREHIAVPAATASPIWLWAPVAFEVAGQAAEPALRFLRAARWVVERDRGGALLQSASRAVDDLGPEVALWCSVDRRAELEVRAPVAVEGLEGVQRRTVAFDRLLRQWGPPARADYGTVGAG